MAIYTTRIDLTSQQYRKDWELTPGDVYSTGSGTTVLGGALYSMNYHITTGGSSEEYVVFSGNTSTSGGAAIFINLSGLAANNKNSDIKRAYFYANKGTTGSAIAANSVNLTIENSVFEKNISTQSGALIADNNANVYVKNTQFIENKSTGEAGTKTYDAGAIYVVNAKVTLEDCFFYGNESALSTDTSMPGRVSGAVAISTSGTLVLKGENILGTSSDTIYNAGNIVFDISENTTAESASRALLNNYNNIYGIRNATLASNISFNIAGDQRSDVYLIAQNASKITEMVPPGAAGTSLYVTEDNQHKTQIAVNAGTMTTLYDTGTKVALKTTENNELLLVVGDGFVFVDNQYKSWEEEATRTAFYRGAPFTGTQETDRHFDKFSKGVKKVQKINEDAGKNIGKLVGVDTGIVTYSVPLKGVTAELTSGTFNKQVFGGTIVTSEDANLSTGADLAITDGIYKSNVIGGDFAQAKQATQTKATSLAISKGTFAKAIAAGSFVDNTKSGSKVSLVGGSNLTIAGGIFNDRVYGGNYATNDKANANNSNIIGDVNVLVKVGAEQIAFNDGLVGGSRGTGAINGNVTVTFTGFVENSNAENSNLVFGSDAKVWGGSNMDKITINSQGEYKVTSAVTKDRLLVFDNFRDDAFEAKIAMFKSIKAMNASRVTFTNKGLDTTIVENWTLGPGCSLTGLAKNDFTGDTLDLTYGGNGAEAIISGDLTGWDKASAVKLNGKTAEWDATNRYWWAATDTAANSAKIKLYAENDKLMLASFQA